MSRRCVSGLAPRSPERRRDRDRGLWCLSRHGDAAHSTEVAMSGGPGSLVLRFTRQVDARLDRVIDDLAGIKVRVTDV